MRGLVLFEIQMMIIFEFRFTELMGLRMISVKFCNTLAVGDRRSVALAPTSSNSTNIPVGPEGPTYKSPKQKDTP
jgi:hypothetical protein